MKVLMTNIALTGRSGSELFTRELARGLVRRGHEVAIFSRKIGPLAATVRSEGVSVCESLDEVPWRPDLLHTHHSLEALATVGHFPDVPALYVCHDARSWFDTPPPLPSIGRYVAVDEYCRERVVRDVGVPPERVAVILNSVDLDIFAPRKEPLGEKPRRALLFVSGAQHTRHIEAVREACRRAELPLDEAGRSVGHVVDDPENLLPHYDLVFGKARCALEAMAVGCAVVLMGREGVGPLVRSESYDAMRRQNFGRRLFFEGDYSAETLLAEMAGYHAEDARRVQRRVRAECGREPMIEAYLSLYEELLADPPLPSSGELVAWLGALAEHAAEASQPFVRNAVTPTRRLRRRGIVNRTWRAIRRWRRRRRHRRHASERSR